MRHVQTSTFNIDVVPILDFDQVPHNGAPKLRRRDSFPVGERGAVFVGTIFEDPDDCLCLGEREDCPVRFSACVFRATFRLIRMDGSHNRFFILEDYFPCDDIVGFSHGIPPSGYLLRLVFTGFAAVIYPVFAFAVFMKLREWFHLAAFVAFLFGGS